MNRCIGFNKNNKKCRTRINDGKLICCSNHKPLNEEILEGCSICCKENLMSSEIATLNCGHSFHKECLNDYLEIAEDKNSCLYCRCVGISPKNKKQKKSLSYEDKFLINGGELHNIIYNLDSVNYC